MLSHLLTLYRGDETKTLLMNFLRACRVSPQGASPQGASRAGRVAARRVDARRVDAKRSSRERDVEPTGKP